MVIPYRRDKNIEQFIMISWVRNALCEEGDTSLYMQCTFTWYVNVLPRFLIVKMFEYCYRLQFALSKHHMVLMLLKQKINHVLNRFSFVCECKVIDLVVVVLSLLL